jgi:hypothetical protein
MRQARPSLILTKDFQGISDMASNHKAEGATGCTAQIRPRICLSLRYLAAC